MELASEHSPPLCGSVPGNRASATLSQTEPQPLPESPRPPQRERRPAEAAQVAAAAPPPTPAQVPSTVLPTASESAATGTPLFRRGAWISLAPSYGFSTLSAIDRATANVSSVASQLSFGLDTRYIQEWSPSIRSFVHLRLGYVLFAQPENNFGAVDRASPFVSGLGIGGSFDLTPHLNWEVTADDQKSLFLRAETTQKVAIDPVSIPILGTRLTYAFLHLDPFKIGISGTFSLLFPAKADSYSIHLGQRFGGTLFITQAVNGELGLSRSFEAELGAFETHQSTSLNTQTETDFTIQLRFFFPVGRQQQEGQ